MLQRLTRQCGAQHLAFIELCRRYDSPVITLQLGFEKVVVVSGSKEILTVLKSEEFTGRPWNEFIKIRNLGKKQGITMNDGQDWNELRGWMVNTLKNFGFGGRGMSEMIKDELVVVLDSLKGGGVKRLKPILTPAVINVLWALTTGKRFCEGVRLEYFMALMERRACVFDMVGGVLSNYPWIRYVAPEASGYNLLVALNKELKDFLMETINEHKKNYVAGSEADLIDEFIREMVNGKGDTNVYTDDQLVMLLVDLFLAGATTTAIAMDFMFLSMVVYQDVQREVHNEIDSIIASDRLPDLLDRPKLPYTEAVMTESQRMWPVFPVIGPRRVLQDTYLENYSIPKESTIVINIYSVGMDPTLYSKPNEFKPDRYIMDGAYKADPNNLVFGRGKRRCPGQVLAQSALFLLFVGVMQKFTLLPVPGKGPTSVEIVPGLAISPKPYEVLLVPR
ncbi:PREDICTED: probable cytochrome P450 305a1 isoform X2 [Dufourea novaeangliae]|nr:PREDICTED: probable cytochrome P450 305a1 isoform X2 [Dufourea novaeangliae]